MSSSNPSFFDEQAEQSQVKAAIVAKYFKAWAHVVIPTAKKDRNKIAYIDLFAGPGRYKDGAKSTPLLILEQAIADPEMRKMLVTWFNDVDKDNTQSLENAISTLPGVDTLKYKPKVFNEEVGEKLVQLFENKRLVPTLFFVDPWGYKGLSLRLINSVLKDWGCDCIFFFNYNRINMGVNNPFVQPHMEALFGIDGTERIRQATAGMSPVGRELFIVETISQSLKDMGGNFVLPFRFRNSDGNRISHHLFFVSKHVRGYVIMKGIMAKESSEAEQGVASFEYNRATSAQTLLFELNRPIDDLADLLIADFSGQTLSMNQIYEKHHIGKRYIDSNYKAALLSLEDRDLIKTTPPRSNRKLLKGKPTFGPNVMVTFP